MNTTLLKKISVALVTASISFSSFSGEIDLLQPEVLGQSLTPFWAQEYIGSDLIIEELQGLETKKVDLAVFDLGFEEEHITLSEGFLDIEVPYQKNGRRRMRAHHGTSIVNLLTGPEKYRVTNHAQLINLSDVVFSGKYHYIYRKFEEKNHFPKVISNSLGWSDERIPEVVSKLEEKGALWFLAAGNSFPKPVNEIEINSKALLVGSFSPSGLTSYEAQNHKDLLVLAPANEELLTINGYGEPHMFGASSGATPLVAGTTINLLALRDSLTREQIKKLIKETAFSSTEHKLGLKEMPGLLNGYKAFKVLERLHLRCLEDEECFNNELKRKSNFVFEISSELEDKLNCFEFIQAADKEEMLKELRRLSFLGSKFHQMETACAYRSLGFAKNAEFFDFISSEKLNLKHMEEQAKKAHDEAIYQISYYRYGPYYSKEYLEHLESSPMKDYHKKILKELKKKHLSGN